jgi:serine/threonine protein kinase
MSLQTKIHIFYQIALTLKYLRDFKIIYFNLRPTNIAIKKGITVKIFDFTNAYHHSI